MPSTSRLSARELAGRLASAAGAGAPEPVLSRLPRAELERLGRTDPVVAEVPEMHYLYDRPDLLDASVISVVLAVGATPVDRVLEEMVAGSAAS